MNNVYRSYSHDYDEYYKNNPYEKLDQIKFNALSKDCLSLLSTLSSKYYYLSVSKKDRIDFYNEVLRLIKNYENNYILRSNSRKPMTLVVGVCQKESKL